MLCPISFEELQRKIYPHYDELDEVHAAQMTEGVEDELKYSFYRLNNRVLRCVYNRHSTQELWHYVEGEDRELFDCYYPVSRRLKLAGVGA